MPVDFQSAFLNDSKQLSEKDRYQLRDIIDLEATYGGGPGQEEVNAVDAGDEEAGEVDMTPGTAQPKEEEEAPEPEEDKEEADEEGGEGSEEGSEDASEGSEDEPTVPLLPQSGDSEE